MRCVEMQDWPAWLNPATRILSAATSQLASDSMITGALLPSSRPTFLRGARALIPQPTSGEPVNVMSAMSGSSTSALPTVDPLPVTTFKLAERETALLEQHFRQGDGREGRLAGRLEHDRAASGDRGCHLVGDEVQREVEGADGTDDTDRHAEGEAELPFSRRGRVERDHLACELSGLHGRELERPDRALGFDPSGADGLGRLLGDDPRELLDPLLQPLCGGVEDLGSPPRWKGRARPSPRQPLA